MVGARRSAGKAASRSMVWFYPASLMEGMEMEVMEVRREDGLVNCRCVPESNNVIGLDAVSLCSTDLLHSRDHVLTDSPTHPSHLHHLHHLHHPGGPGTLPAQWWREQVRHSNSIS